MNIQRFQLVFNLQIRLFLKGMKEEGVSLEEPEQILEEEMYFFARKRPTLPWEVTEEDALNPELERHPDDMFQLPPYARWK